MTRIIDQIPFAEPLRNNRHDELTYRAWAIAPAIAKALEAPGQVCHREAEYPAGGGFCDLAIVVGDLATWRKPVGRRFGIRAIIVEVKTAQDQATGGYILRQLKYYQKKLFDEFTAGIMMCLVHEGEMPESAALLLHASGVVTVGAEWVDESFARQGVLPA